MTTTLFGTQLLSLPEIFESRFFAIPDYQRGYAWDEKQVNELLKDIEHLMHDGVILRHYTGTLVFSRPDSGTEHELNVVDGQQRLTTLVILMRLLCDYLPLEEQREFSARYVRRGAIGNERTVLRLNSDTREFFEIVILGDGATGNAPAMLDAHQRLLDARTLISRWLKGNLQDHTVVASVRTTVETELGFLVFAPKEDAETGIMFEVINNRGKPLSELEKVKNYLIYCSVKLGAPTLRNTIDTSWSGILRDLSTAQKTTAEDEGAFLRYCVAVHFRLNKSASQYGYDELKKLLQIDSAIQQLESREVAIRAIEQFVLFLKAAALWYARLYGQESKGVSSEVLHCLNLIRSQEQQASILPLFLALVIRSDGHGSRLVALLKLLEIVNFRVYLARNMTSRNDTGQGDLYYFATRYYHGDLLEDIASEAIGQLERPIETLDDALEYSLVQFVLWHAADDRFKASFLLAEDSPDDFYCWGGLRYFLMNYEATLQPNKTIQIEKILLTRSQGKSADYLSVEHLWALENRSQEGENNRKIDRFEKRRLGNFVLLELRLNIQGKHDNLEAKLGRYLHGMANEHPTDLEHVRQVGRSAAKLLAGIAQRPRTKNYYLDFHRDLSTLQEKRFVDFAFSRWSIVSYLGYSTASSLV